MSSKKIKIGFRELDFYNDTNTHANIAAIRAKIDKELKAILDDAPTVTDYENVSVEIYKFLEDKHQANNALNLKGEKLAELTGVVITQLAKLEKQLKDTYGHPNMKEPKAEDYTMYAETPREIEVYEDCIGLIKALAKFDEHKTHILNCVRYLPMITYNVNSLELEPNPNYIKNAK